VIVVPVVVDSWASARFVDDALELDLFFGLRRAS
jgi:hypothetical protein